MYIIVYIYYCAFTKLLCTVDMKVQCPLGLKEIPLLPVAIWWRILF